MGIVIRQSIKATMVNYAGTILGFVTTMFVVTRFLRPEEIGLTKVIYEIGALVAGFAQLGTSASAMRFFPYFRNKERQHNGFFFYLMAMPCIGLLVFLPLLWLLRSSVIDFFSSKSPMLVNYFDWTIPLIVFLVFWIVLETYANVMLRIVVPKFIREIGVRVMLLSVYLLYAFRLLSLDGFVTGCVLTYGLAMLFTLAYVSRIAPISLKHDTAFIDKPLRKKIFKYTFFLIAAALSGNIISQLDLFMVSSQMGLNYAGVYTIALYMAAIIDIPSRSITSISSPLAASALKDGDLETANRLYKKVSLHQLVAGSSLFLLIWVNIDNIFAIIPNGEIFQAGKWVVFFLGLSRLVSVTLNFGGTLISFSRYYYWSLYFTCVLTAITIVSNILLIPVFGINGAALATLATCLLSYAWQQWIVLRKVKGNPYSIGLLKQLLLVAALLVINTFIPSTPSSPVVDALFRTVVISALLVGGVLTLRVSTEINQMLQTLLRRIRILHP